jgi:hypothetical protein
MSNGQFASDDFQAMWLNLPGVQPGGGPAD